MKILVLKPLFFRKLGHSSEMRNDALMHREGLKGFKFPKYRMYSNKGSSGYDTGPTLT